MTSLPDIARATAERLGMLPEGAPVVALVSGGADSVALLRLLHGGDLGWRGPLSVLHVNHLLRGDESDADEGFVADLCESLRVPLTSVCFDVAAYAKEADLNLEDAGRRVRYRFAEEALDTACETAGVAPAAGRIATAHTRDDRVETFLMRAIKGAGAAGFSSIPFVRDRIVRPLLECDRADIRAYLTGIGQPWREDSSNADTERLRALVRAEIVPVAERINPSFRETLARSIDLLADDDAVLAGMADWFATDFSATEPGECVRFDRERMLTLDRAMARRAVRTALARAFPESARLEAAHVDAVVDGFARDSFARDLSCGLRAQVEYGTLTVSRAGKEPPAVKPSLLPLPGHADLGDAGRITAEETTLLDTAGTRFSVTIDGGGLDALTVDGIRAGDRMRPFGMDGSRKVSDLLVDAKVPRRERGAVPVVRDGERIVWLAGVRASEEYRVVPQTARAVRLTWTPAEGSIATQDDDEQN
jgi:tRNA(Ile)-lysidine synthase